MILSDTTIQCTLIAWAWRRPSSCHPRTSCWPSAADTAETRQRAPQTKALHELSVRVYLYVAVKYRRYGRDDEADREQHGGRDVSEHYEPRQRL